MFNTLLEKQETDPIGNQQIHTHGIIGIFNISTYIFIVVITESQQVGTLNGSDNIYLVKNVEFIPFSKQITNYRELPKPIVDYVEGIKKLLVDQGFYFSYHADLTSSQQRQSTVKFEYKPGVKNDFKYREQFMDKRYFWNHKIV